MFQPAWARAPTSCARRCTTSTTRATATSRCAPRAPPSVARAFVAAPPAHAVEGLVRRAELPLRAARRPAGYRQHHQLGVEALGSADPDLDVEVIALALGLLRRARPAPGRARAQLDGHARRPRAATSTTLPRLPRRPRRRPRPPTTARRSRRNPMRVLDSKRAETTRPSADAPRIARPALDDEARAHFERVQAGLARRSASPFRHRAPAGPRPRLLHAHHLRVRRATRSTPPSRPSAAAAATTAWSRRWAARRRRASGSARASSGSCSACDAEGVFAAPATARRRVRRRRHRRRPRPATSPSSCAAPGIAADRAFDGRSMKAQMKAADRSGAAARR